MRCVTRKPPATLMVATSTATAPRTDAAPSPLPRHQQHAADEDDAADGVGDAHQRRVQRRRDVPDDVPADDAGEQEDREVPEELRRRQRAAAPAAPRTPAPMPIVIRPEVAEAAAAAVRPPRPSRRAAARRCGDAAGSAAAT